ncbi:hypothetical protein QTI42_02915 [Clostridium perfringens]|uniref:hypothetical protein n=1 Tax=Clostridium perfringens TaxID=1502 RepID=UPI001C85D632|nr:hypothetical protein [Clostridium perfringens]MDK0582240.1 hypothetical protein [Clostridium perfringens]MDK0737873.1 hypothetical protein [Clostridium perfringens]MDM0744585.1 hypothetical protein [Clostridium perfringens]MDM0756178.1 hypothetical protein [Clostridium perfringens]MDM0759096.1 hypothetical protein [Clostridium perfringens]
MQYLVEGNLPSTLSGGCGCWINVAGHCKELSVCVAHGCGSNNGPCPTHCYSKVCNPRQDPILIK